MFGGRTREYPDAKARCPGPIVLAAASASSERGSGRQSVARYKGTSNGRQISICQTVLLNL